MQENNIVIRFLKKNFNSQISTEEEKYILDSFLKETFRKKELVFRYGDANTKHYFIESGLMRLYLIDKSGKEFNILFARENQIIGDLITPEPTDFNLEAIEETTVYSISDQNFEKLIDTLSLKHKSNPDSSIRRSYINIQKRLVSILANTAEENYLAFKYRNPDFIQRLPQYHIASYLGITPEFLSKIITKTARNI